MEYVKIRNGNTFKGKIPKILELPVAGPNGVGTMLEEKSSEDEEALHRWMFREGYVPEDEWMEEEGLLEKHGTHDQSTHGRGGGGGTEEAMEKLNALSVENGWVEAGDVFAETADGEPYEDISGYQEGDLKEETVSIDKLISTQPVLEKSALERYIQDPEATSDMGVGDKPFIVKAGRSYYIHDGHHRVAALKLLGKTDVVVSVLAGRIRMDEEDDWDGDDWDDD